MDKVTRQCPQTTTFLKRKESRTVSNRGPSAYQPNALPLGQTGSRVCCCCRSLLYSAIFRSRADLLRLHEWLAFFIARFWISTKVCTYSADMAGAKWNCCCLGAFCVHPTNMHHVTSCGTDTEIRVNTEIWHWRTKFSHRSCRDLNPRPFNHESRALTTVCR